MDEIEDYRDIESLDAYKDLIENVHIPAETVMGYLKAIGRDKCSYTNAVDDSENAGFNNWYTMVKSK